MKVKRIVANIQAKSNAEVKLFYQGFLGLDSLMDLDWIQTYGSDTLMPIQISIASQGGSDTAVPVLSIEVDSISKALDKARQYGLSIEYGPVQEPWGVHRFFIRDPLGNLINILQHD